MEVVFRPKGQPREQSRINKPISEDVTTKVQFDDSFS